MRKSRRKNLLRKTSYVSKILKSKMQKKPKKWKSRDKNSQTNNS